MSILICVLNQESAWLGADTDATKPDGSRLQMQKVLALPGAALAGRGSAGFLYAVHSKCLDYGMTDMDDALAWLPHALTWVAAQIVLSGEAYVNETTGLDGRQEIILAGWSARLGRPAARVYHGNIGDGIFLPTDIAVGSFAMAPAIFDPKTEEPPPLNSLEDLAKVARAQVAKIRAENPNCAAGGDFMVARVEQDQTTISRECSLEGGGAVTVPGVLV